MPAGPRRRHLRRQGRRLAERWPRPIAEHYLPLSADGAGAGHAGRRPRSPSPTRSTTSPAPGSPARSRPARATPTGCVAPPWASCASPSSTACRFVPRELADRAFASSSAGPRAATRAPRAIASRDRRLHLGAPAGAAARRGPAVPASVEACARLPCARRGARDLPRVAALARAFARVDRGFFDDAVMAYNRVPASLAAKAAAEPGGMPPDPTRAVRRRGRARAGRGL